VQRDDRKEEILLINELKSKTTSPPKASRPNYQRDAFKFWSLTSKANFDTIK